MNAKQIAALVVTLLGVAAVILYPPFYVKLLGGVIQNGHHLLFDPPNPIAKVDILSVTVRCLVLLVVGGCFIALLADRRPPK